ncbi:hypothetical protein ANN_02462 [Periplaneta americana]|uniref:Uncharacterized protein n=1 Tax=Periplaneta americana TaxID=6978 RepID=A0ABQ8TXZ9_PERAM|nr:hypothetical protein ANN_02462 [Periplaneta americana]
MELTAVSIHFKRNRDPAVQDQGAFIEAPRDSQPGYQARQHSLGRGGQVSWRFASKLSTASSAIFFREWGDVGPCLAGIYAIVGFPAQHSLETGHKIDFGATTILDKTSGYWDLVIKEAIEIHLNGNNFNRDGSLQLSTAWKAAINTLRPPAHGRQLAVASFRLETEYDILGKHLNRLGSLPSPACILCHQQEDMDRHLAKCPALKSSKEVDRYWEARARMRTLEGHYGGKGPVGRPWNRWEDMDQEDTASLLPLRDWKVTARDREEWRGRIGEAMDRKRAEEP